MRPAVPPPPGADVRPAGGSAAGRGAPGGAGRAAGRAPGRARALLRDRGTRVARLGRFGSVGALAYLVDVGIFNLLRFGPGELLEAKPLTAKALSVAVATVVAWLGNRYWTFADRRTGTRTRELVGFAVVNLGGLAIGLACLGFSHYVLGLRSPLADNISANVVGLVLGTAFRYACYHRLVFTGADGDRSAAGR